MDTIQQKIRESIAVKEKISGDAGLIRLVQKAADMIIACYQKKPAGRVFFAGNGGSAADAQHLAAELVSRFYKERTGLAAEALNTNTSILTAVANDYDFDRVFARQIEANATAGDVFVGLSTSGNSKNILSAIAACKAKGVNVIGFTGQTGGKMDGQCDLILKIPSNDTPRIQESHILLGHIICELVEKTLFQ